MTTKAVRSLSICLLLAGLAAIPLTAQDRLKTYPGYDRYIKLSREIPGAVRQGSLQVSWKDAKTFEYMWDGKLHRYDVAARTATVVGDAQAAQPPGGRRGGGGPDRGRQFETADSPDGTKKAIHRARN